MSATVQVHGMDGTLVEGDWPALTLDELRRLLSLYPACGEPVRILSVSPRPFSAASVVETTTGRVFVKRHARSVRTAGGLGEEHRFMRFLRQRGAAVPQVLSSAAGDSAIETGEWTYEVHEVPAGVDAYEQAISWTPFRSVAHARAAGAALAQLHNAAEGYAAPARRVQPLVASFSIFASDDATRGMERYLAQRPALTNDAATRRDCAQALELLQPFHEELKPLLPALHPLWTHNDLHASNLLWSDAGDAAQAAAVIDFGLADRTNAVHDLAHAIERNIVEWLALTGPRTQDDRVPIHFDHLAALLEGYESVRALGRKEALALAPMLALCHAEFALTEADYFLGVLHSPERGRIATEGYLVRHAHWFRSARGRQLLDAIRIWARKHPDDGGRRAR